MSSSSTSTQKLSNRKQNIAKHFANATDYNLHASIQAQICDLLITQILSPHHESVLEIGAGQGQLTNKLAQAITAEQWHINELCDSHTDKISRILPSAHLHIGDGESLSLSSKHSLIASANAVQWFDNPLGFIQHSAKHLQTGGQLLFNTFTPNNFLQIKQLTNQGLDYPLPEQWQKELDKHCFEIKSIDTHAYHLPFSSPKEVLKHIKQTGVSVNSTHNSTQHPNQNQQPARPSFVWTKSSLQRFVTDYQKLFSNELGQVILTYEALVISAVKAH